MASQTSTEIASAPADAKRARTRPAPPACSDTPRQQNGSLVSVLAWVFSTASPRACSTASNTAGCIPIRSTATPASPGATTSANSSDPRRQIATRP
ncbi:Uncharacterised protein [Mycobacterium tuberculosis]|uniref:Uncharacterized protein n=1 Tax=Mycobacterium tuberculosis TaxID=1773 RepID=A0A0U0TMR2_MYCTX|nr:Uncharacterised protein [Mycobacterium tuberculosis]COX78983.1 Uncharacterised protein [Mycobacterium tuberculosis]